jgi:hypothetical protein
MITFFRCYADDPRYKSEFKSDNGIFILKVSKLEKEKIKDESGSYIVYTERKWGLYKLSDKKPIYEIPGPISERSAYISNDGKYIVVINDWPPEQANDSLELILIYVNGELIKSFKLSDIYNCGYNITSSVSHFDWIWGEVKVNFIDNTLKFKTFELVEFKINISNGDLLDRKLDRRINKESRFVYGDVFGEKNGGYRIEVCHRVYGNIDSSGIVYFSSDYKYHGGWSYSVLINDGKEVRITEDELDIHNIIFNYCAFEMEKLGIKPLGLNDINCR